MSGAAAAAHELRRAEASAYEPVLRCGKTYAAAHATTQKTEDVVEVMRAAAESIMAVEALREAADEAAKTLRQTLAQQMQDTGCTSFATAHQSVYIARKQAVLHIDDEKAIPDEYWVQPPPQLDRQRLKHDVREGVCTIPGVSLVRPNDSVLVIKGLKKERAA